MNCPDCVTNDWVIVGGGSGLPPGWGRWRCFECGHIGLAEFEEMNRKMKLKKAKEKKERIKAQNEARAAFATKKQPFKNTRWKRQPPRQ